jgi:hypothetical protein
VVVLKRLLVALIVCVHAVMSPAAATKGERRDWSSSPMADSSESNGDIVSDAMSASASAGSDVFKAFKYWQQAADAGHPEAMFHLGTNVHHCSGQSCFFFADGSPKMIFLLLLL